MDLHTITDMLMHKSPSQRFIELDVFRGFAIIFMIFLHVLWDLDYFGIMPLNKNIYQFNIICPSLFFLIVGMCLAVSYNKNQQPNKGKMYPHLFGRGLKILVLGTLLTGATYLYLPEKPILFGVLHCIGLSIILSIPFLRFKTYNIIFAAAIILLGVVMGLFPVENPTVLALAVGFHPADVWAHTVDYFPLFPWFGVSLLGIAAGNVLYKNNERQFSLPDLSKYKPVALFSWLGKHSLAIYLFHQPIIAGVLSLYIIL